MAIASIATFMMANISDIDDPDDEPAWNSSFFDGSIELHLIEKKELSNVYDIYLFVTSSKAIYMAWLASKDEEGNPVGWQFVEYDLAKKIFPNLKSHKFEYMGPTS
jgi:hypothetical protein